MLISKLNPYVLIYFFLSSISLLADSIFLYYIGMLLLQKENGGLLCGLVLGIDAFFEVLLGPFLANFIDRVTDFKSRLQTSLKLQFCLAILTFLFALFRPKGVISMIVPLACIRLLSLVDAQLKSALPLHLERKGNIPLMQSLSFNVFSQRCILLMSSSFALFFLNYSWFLTCLINSISYLSAIIALLIVIKFFSDNENQPAAIQLTDEKENVEQTFEQKKWIRWNYRIVFLSGIAFGAVPLILTKSMLIATHESFFTRILLGPAPIYTGVFISLLLMMAYPIKISLLAGNGRCVSVISFCIGLGLILTAFTSVLWRPFILLFLGLINGIGLVGLDTFFQRKIEGRHFVRVVARNQAFAKGGILISLWSTGLFIDRDFTPSHLLLLCGLSAALFFFYLFLETFFIEGRKSVLQRNH